VTSVVVCNTCNNGYDVINGSCLSVCGNGFVLTPEICDDGNKIDGDGCSSNCSI
jgi:cysteine-rich repeat protein